LDGVTFRVAGGELLAIIGVAGNGQAELAAMLRGLVPSHPGRISISGQAMSRRALLRTSRVAHIPEDRTRDGIVAEMSVAENIALTAPRWRPAEARERARRLIAQYGIRARGPRQRAGALSGGNQQKVILARELDRRPSVIVAAEPTRGLDLESTRFVHARLREAVAGGGAVLLITSDLDEAFALADALHVIYRGRLSERLAPATAAVRLANLMAGVA
jgi:simple sugar transport system ATP-binding protein